jgi:predicted ATPase
MLTKLEVSGFKNLFDLSVEFGPYTCIAGPNAVGKSNVFDVIEFLSLIADHPFMTAAQLLRSAGERLGDPRTLFWYDGAVDPAKMTIAVEMLVPPTVYDDFGQEAKAASTHLRYDIELEYMPPDLKSPTSMGGIRLVKEDLTYITKGQALKTLPWIQGATVFRNAVARNSRRGKGFISTNDDTSEPSFQVHGDTGRRGPARRSAFASRTVLSTINTAEDPTILAARREMQQWRKLALEPTAMRTPDAIFGPNTIDFNGAHLAAALFRMQQSDPDVYARVAATASALTDVREVTVEINQTKDQLTLMARLGTGPFLHARALSDGTLRFLALSIIEADSQFGGLICMEEPENGIHPAKIKAMVDLLTSLAVDTSEAPGVDNPLRQVIVNTHSPRFVNAWPLPELLLATTRSIVIDEREVIALELLPMEKSWRKAAHGYAMSKGLIGDYLTKPDEAVVELDYPDREISVLD